MKFLWIAFVWPEPESSAAGFRTMQLVNSCISAGHSVEICSPCQPNKFSERLTQSGIRIKQFKPNDPAIDSYLLELRPDIVFFDRFMIEEQFGFRVRESCPAAMRVIDTCDLHSLRRARQKNVLENGYPFTLSRTDLQSDDAIREISAIYRSDLSLIISDAEVSLLREEYNLPAELISLCRFSYPEYSAGKAFSERENFVAIGNFRHPPNADSYKLLKTTIWEKIKLQLSKLGIVGTELHIYGSYPTEELNRLDDPEAGFRIKGWTPDAIKTLSEYRVNLAPLRFGAGIKGKVSDGWAAGTPCVGTSIAAEGMHESLEFGGFIADDWDLYAEKAAELYATELEWNRSTLNGIKIIEELYNLKRNSEAFIHAIEETQSKLNELRERNFISTMLWHHQYRSTEYFSRWIEAKNQSSQKCR